MSVDLRAAPETATPAKSTARILLRRPGTTTLIKTGMVLIALLLPVILASFLTSTRFWLGTADLIVITAIGALGLNVLTGYTGQVSLGHAFFLGVGAYTAAWIGTDRGVSALVWIPAAGVVAALFGAVIGPTALRLRGLYLAIVTIGLVFIGQHLFVNLPSVTGGSQGRGIAQPKLGGADFGKDDFVLLGYGIDRNALYYWLSVGILLLAMLFVWNLTRTRQGRAMQAVREREVAAALMGVDLARTKLMAFVISSFLAGVCGALFGAYTRHVDPLQWDLILSIQFVAIIIVGGVGTVSGALLGAIFVTGLPAVLSNYSNSLPFIQQTAGSGGIAVGDATNIVFGVLIVLFLVVEPRGVIGLVARAGALLRKLTQRRRTAATPV
jgi:branched-chain amino acid transport system permease protein